MLSSLSAVAYLPSDPVPMMRRTLHNGVRNEDAAPTLAPTRALPHSHALRALVC